MSELEYRLTIPDRSGEHGVASANVHGDTVICWGGDVNLGRRQHYRTEEIGVENVLDIPALKTADLSIVNLECVVSTKGEAGREKGEAGPYYYRARPEMLHVLRRAGIDAVAVANNHSGDYGNEALLEQEHWLRSFGLKFAGSGRNLSEALRPAYLQAGPFTVALFSIDATQHRFAATEQSAGIAYLDLKNPKRWRQSLEMRIAEARTKAEIVLVAVHWGKNWASTPDEAEVTVGHVIIDAGADAVLGTSAHVLQGVEIYQGKPIIHDAGDLLFDSKLPDRNAGIFKLRLDRNGIYAVDFVPVHVGFGKSHELPRDQAGMVNAAYRDLCFQLGSTVTLGEDGSARLELRKYNGQATGLDEQLSATPVLSEDAIASALSAINCRDEWVVADVPVDALLEEPLRIGPLTLLGLRCKPRNLTGRAMIWVESFWACDQSLTTDWRLDIRAVTNDKGAPVVWGAGMDHDPCDWMLPTSRWVPGLIYRDYFGLRPPASKVLRNAALEVEIRLLGNGRKTDTVRVPSDIGAIKLVVPSPPNPRPSYARAAISLDQRRPVPISNCLFSFLNVDMGLQRTGVENASLLRAALFVQELQITPTILTSKYNPQLRFAETRLRSAGHLAKGVPLRNMYDDYQEAGTFDPDKHAAVERLKPELNLALDWKSVPNTNDHRVFDQAGRKLMYVARRSDTGRIGYINHFHNDVKWRRDIYDCRGFLSCVQMLGEPDAKVVQEIFLRPDGTAAITKDYRKDEDQNRLERIQITGGNGQLVTLLDDDDALMRHWLNSYVSADDRRHVFLVDKSRILYEPSVDVRDAQADLAKVTVVPIIHALHTRDHRRVGQGPENRNYAGILRDIGRPDALVTLTEGQKDDIVRRYGQAPIAAIGHAYDSRIPPNYFERRDRYKVVYLARYSPEKNHQMAIRAFAHVVRAVPDATLHCHGFGNAGDPTLPALKRLIGELGLESSVFLNGWAQDAAAIYEDAGLAILTSQSEAFALTIMESLCHGCPVVAFDVPYGPPALIRHGHDGFLVPFGDEAAFAQHIIRLLQDETLHRTLSMQARRDSERFSTDRMAQSWLKLLSSLSIGGTYQAMEA